jgi:hypothetical protein
LLLLICIFLVFFLFLSFIVVPRVVRVCRVHCSRAPLAKIRLCEAGFAKYPEFTFHGSPSTSDASGVSRHGCSHVRLRDFFFDVYCSRSAVFCLKRPTSDRMQLFKCTGDIVCGEVTGLCLKLHCCAAELVRTSAGSTPYKSACPIPFGPLWLWSLLLLLLLLALEQMGNWILLNHQHT